MFVKMSISAVLVLFTLGACALPFALDFWGTSPPSTATDIIETQSFPEEKVAPPAASTVTPAIQQATHPAPTVTIPFPGTAPAGTVPFSEGESANLSESPAGRAYVPQAGSPAWLPNFANSELGCNWMGIAGQVLNSDDLPIRNLIVEVGGSLGGSEIVKFGLTGVAPIYGTGGYEIVLADQVVESRQTTWIQIHDLSGQDLSDKLYFDTFADCERNLILVNFVQARAMQKEYLPLLINEP